MSEIEMTNFWSALIADSAQRKPNCYIWTFDPAHSPRAGSDERKAACSDCLTHWDRQLFFSNDLARESDRKRRAAASLRPACVFGQFSTRVRLQASHKIVQKTLDETVWTSASPRSLLGGLRCNVFACARSSAEATCKFR